MRPTGYNILYSEAYLTNIRGISYEEAKEPQTGNYYTASEAEVVLGIDFCLFVTPRHKGLITPVVLRGTRGGYYLKSDVDKLAADLDAFRRRHGSEINGVWFKKRG